MVYIEKEENVEKFLAILKDDELLKTTLQNVDTSSLNFLLNLENLKRVKKQLEENLNNDDEQSFWQEIFENN